MLDLEQASFGDEAWDEKLFLAYYRRYSELFLVATIRRQIVGYIITCAGAKNAELASIAVDPRSRRRGVGRSMLDRTLAELRLRRVKTWWLLAGVENETAIRFYESYGFARTKRVKRYYGPGRDAWRMRYSI